MRVLQSIRANAAIVTVGVTTPHHSYGTPEVANHPRDPDVLGRPKPFPRHEIPVSATAPQLTAAQPGGLAERRSASRGRGHRVARYRRVAVTISVEGNAHKG
jgi:hypothetical protein